jgi:hypothetical protein
MCFAGRHMEEEEEEEEEEEAEPKYNWKTH